MKKFFAILMAICMLASMLCVAVIPASAEGDAAAFLCALGKDGRVWAVGLHKNFEEAWNEAVYYSTHLEEAWNSAEQYESEEDRVGEDGFVRIIVEIYADWNADDNGSFGTGAGFKDGALYVPSGAQLEVNLNGNTINCGMANGRALYVDNGADFGICNGTVIGEIHADKTATTSVNNVYVAGNMARITNGSKRYGSIFGEGSLTMIVASAALIASVVAIVISVSSKKKAIPAKEDQE